MKYPNISQEQKVSNFLITRFNLKMWSKDKNNKSTQSEEWLEDRFKLFKKYTCPTVFNQSDTDFIWIVAFAEDTPQKWKEEVENIRQLYTTCNNPIMIPLFLNDAEMEEPFVHIKKVISEMHDDSKNLITFRCDNDDSLDYDFLKEVKQISSRQVEKEKAHTFKYGIQFYDKLKFGIKIPYWNNHFSFLINKDYNANENFNIILEFNHYYPKTFPFPFESINYKRPMWIEAIHDKNVDNDVKMLWGQVPLFHPNQLSNFKTELSINPLHSIWVFTTFFIPRFLLIATKKLINKIIKK